MYDMDQVQRYLVTRNPSVYLVAATNACYQRSLCVCPFAGCNSCFHFPLTNVQYVVIWVRRLGEECIILHCRSCGFVWPPIQQTRWESDSLKTVAWLPVTLCFGLYRIELITIIITMNSTMKSKIFSNLFLTGLTGYAAFWFADEDEPFYELYIHFLDWWSDDHWYRTIPCIEFATAATAIKPSHVVMCGALALHVTQLRLSINLSIN